MTYITNVALTFHPHNHAVSSGRSRLSDKEGGGGGWGRGDLKKIFQFGLKIRGAPLLNPPLVKIRSKEASPPKRRVSNPITMANILYQLNRKDFFRYISLSYRGNKTVSFRN